MTGNAQNLSILMSVSAAPTRADMATSGSVSTAASVNQTSAVRELGEEGTN